MTAADPAVAEAMRNLAHARPGMCIWPDTARTVLHQPRPAHPADTLTLRLLPPVAHIAGQRAPWRARTQPAWAWTVAGPGYDPATGWAWTRLGAKLAARRTAARAHLEAARTWNAIHPAAVADMRPPAVTSAARHQPQETR